MDYFSGLRFVGFGDLQATDACYANKRFDGYYGIQYTHSGRLQFSVDAESPRVFDGPCAFVTFPGPAFNYGPPPGELRGHSFVCFGGPRAEEFVRAGLLCPRTENAVIAINRAERFYATLRALQTLLAYPGGKEQPRAVLMVEDLLLQLQEQGEAPSHAHAYHAQKIRRLRDEIVSDPVRDWDFSREAAALSLSYSHFRHLFREITGYPPNQFLTECRLNLAGELLMGGAAPLSDVAHASGFPDEFYFSRVFKRRRHVTPSAFRREFRA